MLNGVKMGKRIIFPRLAFLSMLMLLATIGINPPGAHALDNNLFEYEHSCRAALSEHRKNPKLKQWAMGADCHWHPELGRHGMWYLY